jgi:DMSO reductase family type II enzyme chaperone
MTATTVTVDVQAGPVQRALGRSALYRLLSLACAYPSGDRLNALQGEALTESVIGATKVSRKVTKHLDRLATELKTSDIEALEAQYHTIFGHVALPDCPVYEAAYAGSSVFQQVNGLADVAGFYRAFGFAVSETDRERVDHLAVELEFMRVLTYKESYARVNHGPDKVRLCRHAQRRFWREHLGRWLPTFGRLLEERESEGFYGELARVTRSFAETEARSLGRVPEALPQKMEEHPMEDELDCLSGEDDRISGGLADVSN